MPLGVACNGSAACSCEAQDLMDVNRHIDMFDVASVGLKADTIDGTVRDLSICPILTWACRTVRIKYLPRYLDTRSVSTKVPR